ncbi:phospholipase D-like domain-containing protein [Brevibacillus brevis]|nr:phospholipase D-like domain-containing protein [Brevibacillus brevis]
MLQSDMIFESSVPRINKIIEKLRKYLEGMTKMNEIINLDSFKIVLTQGEKNYKEIFDSIDRTSHLYITTFNYSMPEELEESLKENIEFVNDVRVVFNVYNFDGKEEEKVYKLVVKALNKNPYVQFFYGSTNHSKIISTGNKMYIGSSNLTENATNNFEAGVIINNIETIKKSSS